MPVLTARQRDPSTNGNTLSGIFNNGEEPVEGIFTEKDGASFKFNRIIELDTKEVDVEELLPDNIEELLQNSTEIMLNGKTLNIVSSKKWVFTIDDEGDFTWEGMLNNDGESFEECDPPDELLKFYEE